MPEQGPDWFLVATEACGGGTPDLGLFLEVSVYIRGFGVGNKSVGLRGSHEVGGRAPHPCGQPGTLLAQPFYSRGFFWSIKNHQKLARQLDFV